MARSSIVLGLSWSGAIATAMMVMVISHSFGGAAATARLLESSESRNPRNDGSRGPSDAVPQQYLTHQSPAGGERGEVGTTVMSKDQVKAEIQRLFMMHDLNGDGRISFQELVDFDMSLRRKALKELSEEFNRIDKDGDGFITMSEYYMAGNYGIEPNVNESPAAADLPAGAGDNSDESSQQPMDALAKSQRLADDPASTMTMAEMESKIRESFSELDANGDGQITFLEVLNQADRSPMGPEPESMLRQEFDAVDADRNGALSFDEYYAAAARGSALDNEEALREEAQAKLRAALEKQGLSVEDAREKLQEFLRGGLRPANTLQDMLGNIFAIGAAELLGVGIET